MVFVNGFFLGIGLEKRRAVRAMQKALDEQEEW
jgi:hypothetical protein